MSVDRFRNCHRVDHHIAAADAQITFIREQALVEFMIQRVEGGKTADIDPGRARRSACSRLSQDCSVHGQKTRRRTHGGSTDGESAGIATTRVGGEVDHAAG